MDDDDASAYDSPIMDFPNVYMHVIDCDSICVNRGRHL